MSKSTTEISYVIEGRVLGPRGLPGKPWLTLAESKDEDAARLAYDSWLAARGSLEVQLVHRTAVITDEVVACGQQGLLLSGRAIAGEEAAPCGHPGRDGYCDVPGCWSERSRR